MGKGGGQVEGRTKNATWKKFQQEMESAGISFDKFDREADLFVDYPTSREEAFEDMVQKDDKSGWVLTYHFSA